MTDHTPEAADLDGATRVDLAGEGFANAGEFAAWWNSHPAEHRDEVFAAIRYTSETAMRCLLGDHVGRIAAAAGEIAALEARALKAEAAAAPLTPKKLRDLHEEATANAARYKLALDRIVAARDDWQTFGKSATFDDVIIAIERGREAIK